jgi:nucleotide-binding universal stress UspA family protein
MCGSVVEQGRKFIGMKTKVRNRLRGRQAAAAPGKSAVFRLSLAQAKLPKRARIQTIVVPTDFSARSKEAVHYASALATDYGARLCLVFVYEPLMIVEGLEAYAVVRSNQQMLKRVRERLGIFARDEIDETIPVQSEVRIGKPHREIVAAAKEEGADLIVIATHGYTGLKHAFVGSTAERVVRIASCPVLVVRRKHNQYG